LENEGSTFDVYLALRLHRLFGAPGVQVKG
jgi:hypothetical protein